jgi:NitT/TauT family transport system substrate-binding protein
MPRYQVHKVFLILVFASLLVCSMLLGCNGKPTGPQTIHLTIGYLPVSTSLPNWAAQSEGYYKKHGLDVAFKRYASSDLLLLGLLNREIQATSVCADEPILAALAKGHRGYEIYLQEILVPDRAFDAIIVKNDSPIEGINDLKGKTIACFPGSQLKAYLEIILERAGVDPSTVSITQLPPPNMLPALLSGTVDACFALEPILTIASAKQKARIIVPSPICKYIGEGSPICAASYLISTEWADQNPAAADAFVSSVYDAVAVIQSDYERISLLYPDFTPIPVEIAPQVVITDFATLENADFSGLQTELKILRDAGVIKRDISLKGLIYRWRTKGDRK